MLEVIEDLILAVRFDSRFEICHKDSNIQTKDARYATLRFDTRFAHHEPNSSN